MGEPQQIPVPPPAKAKKSNCLLFGCIGIVAVFAVIIVGGGIVSYLGLRSFAEQYTEAEPRQLPITTISEDEYAALSQRYADFLETVREQEPTSITLSAGDINALIRNHPDFRDARGVVFVTIDDEVMGGEISYPIPPEIPMLGGRYVNGSATFRLEVVGGRPALYFDTIEVAGKTPPDEMLGQMRQENFLQGFYSDPEFGQVLNRVESIRVADGALEIVTK